MAQPGAITQPRNELLDISQIIANLSPVFLGTGKTTTSQSTGGAPEVYNAALARATSSAHTDALIQDILYRSQLAFAPVLGEEKSVGLYNTSTKLLLGQEASRRATAAAASAVLQDQQASLQVAAQTAPRQQQQTQKTKPVIDPALSLAALLGIGGAQKLLKKPKPPRRSKSGAPKGTAGAATSGAEEEGASAAIEAPVLPEQVELPASGAESFIPLANEEAVASSLAAGAFDAETAALAAEGAFDYTAEGFDSFLGGGGEEAFAADAAADIGSSVIVGEGVEEAASFAEEIPFEDFDVFDDIGDFFGGFFAKGGMVKKPYPKGYAAGGTVTGNERVSRKAYAPGVNPIRVAPPRTNIVQTLSTPIRAPQTLSTASTTARRRKGGISRDRDTADILNDTSFGESATSAGTESSTGGPGGRSLESVPGFGFSPSQQAVLGAMFAMAAPALGIAEALASMVPAAITMGAKNVVSNAIKGQNITEEAKMTQEEITQALSEPLESAALAGEVGAAGLDVLSDALTGFTPADDPGAPATGPETGASESFGMTGEEGGTTSDTSSSSDTDTGGGGTEAGGNWAKGGLIRSPEEKFVEDASKAPNSMGNPSVLEDILNAIFKSQIDRRGPNFGVPPGQEKKNTKDYAKGGLIDGNIGQFLDAIEIKVTPGEYVLPVETVKRLGGEETLDRIVKATNWHGR